MPEVLDILFKISLVVFMAGNLLDMGLKLDPRDALRGLRSVRFVIQTLLWGFVLGPAVAYGVTMVMPLDSAYATGLILMGMTPCAPFLPMIMLRARGDLGFTAAYMMLASAGTVLFMPVAVPLMVEGLTVSAWTIAKPLLVVILLPLAVGMVVLHRSPGVAARLQPIVKKTTGLFTIATALLCMVIYGKGLLGVAGSLAVASQIIFFFIVTAGPYWLGFGLPHGQKIVVSAGMATRNLGAAFAPLLAVSDMDQRATIMVVLGFPIMVVFAILATKWFRAPVATAGRDAEAATAVTERISSSP